jgi:hypothetical protein
VELVCTQVELDGMSELVAQEPLLPALVHPQHLWSDEDVDLPSVGGVEVHTHRAVPLVGVVAGMAQKKSHAEIWEKQSSLSLKAVENLDQPCFTHARSLLPRQALLNEEEKIVGHHAAGMSPSACKT